MSQVEVAAKMYLCPLYLYSRVYPNQFHAGDSDIEVNTPGGYTLLG